MIKDGEDKSGLQTTNFPLSRTSTDTEVVCYVHKETGLCK